MPGTVVCGACAGIERGVAEGWEAAERRGGVLLRVAGWCVRRGRVDREGFGHWSLGLALSGAGIWHGVGAKGVGRGMGGGDCVGVYENDGAYVVPWVLV